MERPHSPIENFTRREHWREYVEDWFLLPQILAGLVEQLAQLNQQIGEFSNHFEKFDNTSQELLAKLEQASRALDVFIQLIPPPLLFLLYKKRK